MWIKAGNNTSTIVRATEHEAAWLRQFLTFPERKFVGSGPPKIEKKCLLSAVDNSFPSGLIRSILDAAKIDKVEIEIIDKRVKPCAPDPNADLAWLRDYQLEATLKAGQRARGIIQIPTGGGKGELVVALTRHIPCDWVFIVHRQGLANDIAERYERHNGVQAGMIAAGRWEPTTEKTEAGATLTCATFQTLARAYGTARYDEFVHSVQGAVIDECFVAGTRVELNDCKMPIESVIVGDMVRAYDVDNDRWTVAPVVRTYKSTPSRLVHVQFDDGRSVVCTPNHKLRTPSGWVEAQHCAGAYVIRSPREQMQEVRSGDNAWSVLPAVQAPTRSTPQDANAAEEDDSLRRVREAVHAFKGCVGQLVEWSNQERLLLANVPHGMEAGAQQAHSAGERYAAVGAHACEQPDAQRTDAREGAGDTRGAGNSPSTGGRQRRGHDRAPKGPPGRFRRWLATRVRGRREGAPGAPTVLQDRHSAPGAEDRDRGGREQPQQDQGAQERRAQDGVPGTARVASVAVLEPGSDGRFGGLCADGLVYNLEVEGVHTYTANGLLVSNCHTLPAASFWNVAMSLENAFYRIALSATPLARGDKRSVYTIAAAGPIIHRTRPKELIDRGILARPIIRMVKFDQETKRNQKITEIIEMDQYDDPDYVPPKESTWRGSKTELLTKSTGRNKLVTAMAKKAVKPALVFVEITDHGKRLQKMIEKAGMRAAFVWGTDAQPVRDRACERLVRGELDVVVCSSVFQEGLDMPELESVVIASGGKSLIATLQRIGRGMRSNGGKKKTFEVWDVMDTGNRFTHKHARERRNAYLKEGHDVAELEEI